MTDSLRAGTATHVGLVRSHNEDAIGVVPGQGLYIVADGIGGEACGELASAIAVETVERMVAQGAPLQKAIIAAEQAIAGAVSSGQGRAGMGTTIVVLQIKGNNFRLAWMGDSRAYRINDGIERLSRDHSLVQELLDRGVIDENEARKHPRRNVITRALGSISGVENAVAELSGTLSAGDIFLLCSDGLHGLLSDGDINKTVVSAQTPQAAADALVQRALDAGGNDNVSVIVVRA